MRFSGKVVGHCIRSMYTKSVKMLILGLALYLSNCGTHNYRHLTVYLSREAHVKTHSILPVPSNLFLLESFARSKNTVGESVDRSLNGSATRLQRTLEIFLHHTTGTKDVSTQSNSTQPMA